MHPKGTKFPIIHSKTRKKQKQWKRNMSQALVQQYCDNAGKSLNDPYWKKQIASLLSGCVFIKRKHKNFNEMGMNYFKNNLCNKILFYNLYTVLEFKYKKTNRSIMNVRLIQKDPKNKLRITDIIFKIRWSASKFKEKNHKLLFANPFFNFVFNADIKTVRPAGTSEYCYIEWKDNGKWAWIAMSYIYAFGDKNEIDYFKRNVLRFYPDMDFDKIYITDIIKTQNYLGQNNDLGQINDSNRNNNIKSNGNNDNDYNDDETESENENKSENENDNKKNGNNNNNKHEMDDINVIITCPHCKEFTFDENSDDMMRDFRAHLLHKHKGGAGFMETQRYLRENGLIDD